MTQIPIKLLKDKTQRPFIPYVPAEAITVNGTNYMLGDPEGLLELLKVVPQYNASKEQIFEQNNGTLRWVDKTIIPTKTSQLTNDSHFPVDANYVHTDNNYTSTDKNKLAGIAAGAEVNVQSDWNETNTASDSYIKNKPIIPTKISDLINDSTFEDANNKTTNVSKNSTDTEYPSAKAVYDYVYNHAAPAYLGAITEFNTQAKALDITDLKPGLYLLYGDYYNAGENLYIKYKFNDNYVYGHKMFMQIHFVNHQLCLKINEIETPTVGDILGSISYSEITDGGSSDANTIPIELNTNSISFNAGTNQGFTAVKTTDDQSIGGLKTFSIAPRSLAAPLANTDLANKEYVDSVAGGGGTDVGPVVEYLGAASNYNTAANALDLNTLKPGRLYMLSNFNESGMLSDPTGTNSIYLKATTNNTTATAQFYIYQAGVGLPSDSKSLYEPIYIYRYAAEIPETLTNSEIFLGSMWCTLRGESSVSKFAHQIRLVHGDSVGTRLYNGYGVNTFWTTLTLGAQTIHGAKTFSDLPKCSRTPASTDDLTNKNYVDNIGIVKVSSLPTASSSYNNQIKWYNAPRTFDTQTQTWIEPGHLYLCEKTSETGSTYAWIDLIERQAIEKQYKELGLQQYEVLGTYAVGDYCYYKGKIYKALVAKPQQPSLDFTVANWELVSYLDYLSEQIVGNALGGSY